MGKLFKAQVLRCPFCVADGQFKPMTAQAGDLYLCDGCGHLAQPSNPSFDCTCGKCMGLELKSKLGHPSGLHSNLRHQDPKLPHK